MLQYGAPIWGALLGWLLIKEKPHWEHWFALALVIGGLVLIFRDGLDHGLGRQALLGNAIAVLCGIVFGAHSVFLRMLKTGNPGDTMLLAHIICAAIGLPFIFLYPPAFTVSSTLSILYMGVFQIGMASLLFAYGLKLIRAVEALLIDSIEPVLNPIWVLVITGEKPSMAALAGGAAIITAVIFSSVIGMRREKKPQC
jgi:drug/metabolite transporter (DMT)-like permease